MRAVLLLAIFTVGAFAQRAPLCQSQVDFIKGRIREIVGQEHMIAAGVRLAFHDCLGGCDGCIDFNRPNNAGNLAALARAVYRMYDEENLADVISIADINVLIGIAAVENGVANSDVFMPEPEFEFRYGRIDCPTSPGSNVFRPFAPGNINHGETLGFFNQHFGMNELETSAILGVHTVGEVTGGSGFFGTWKENITESFKFDNRYFQKLADPNIEWVQSDVSGFTNHPLPRFQWDGFNRDTNEQEAFMLHVDMATFMHLDLDPDTRESRCNFENCERIVEVEDQIFRFATDSTAMLRGFESAYTKMTVSGATNLRTPNPLC